jgi:hypothetical protein
MDHKRNEGVRQLGISDINQWCKKVAKEITRMFGKNF